MKTNKYIVTLEVEITVAQSLEDAVLTPEWRKIMYRDVDTPEKVACHLAWNMVQGSDVTNLDGFADQPEDAATLGPLDVVYVERVVEKPKAARRGKR